MVHVIDSGPGDEAPAAPGKRRDGLTSRERERLSRTEARRAQTRPLREAPLPGLLLWLLWRGLIKGFQPLWLILSLAVATWYGAQWLDRAGGVRALAEPPPGEAARLEAAVAAAVPLATDPRTFWVTRLTETGQLTVAGRPDIDAFRSWAALGPDLIGRERIALESLAGSAGPRHLDARLRAGPPWQRTAALQAEFSRLMQQAQQQDLDPPELFLAPDSLVQRYRSARTHWSIANSTATAFFRGNHTGELQLRTLPGLVAPDAGDTRLYGGIRHLALQACAHRPAGLIGCTAPAVPAEPADPLRYALAALESGLVELRVPDSTVRAGAEILQAARIANRLTPQLESELSTRLAALLPPDDISQALAASGHRLDLAFSVPAYARDRWRGAIDRRHHPEAVALSELLRDIAAIRSETSPVLAIRLMSGAASSQDLRGLAALAGLAGERTLAVRDLLGANALAPAVSELPRGAVDPELKRGAILALSSALAVLLLTLIRLITPVRMRRASRLNALDAVVSRSLLGRKV